MNRLTALALVLPILGQDAPPDWQISRDPDAGATLAYTGFSNGLTIVARCQQGRYEVLLAGLPPAREDEEENRELRVAFGDEELASQRWSVAVKNTTAVSDLPAPFARNLREGGRLQIQVPNGAGEGRNVRYDLTLPSSPASIDETLTACGRPLVDPRDAELESLPETGLPSHLVWVRAPRGQYPGGRTYTQGFAVVSCITDPDGSLRDCTVESEYPQDGGFGDAALKSARDARTGNGAGPSQPVPTSRVIYRVQFRVAPSEGGPREMSPSRRRQR